MVVAVVVVGLVVVLAVLLRNSNDSDEEIRGGVSCVVWCVLCVCSCSTGRSGDRVTLDRGRSMLPCPCMRDLYI